MIDMHINVELSNNMKKNTLSQGADSNMYSGLFLHGLRGNSF